MLGMDGVILRGHGQLGQAHEHAAVGRPDDVGVDDVHVVGRLTGDLTGVVEDLLFEHLRGLPDGEACGEGLAGGVGAEARRGDVGILTGDDVDLLIVGQAEDLGAHLRVGGIRALADLGLADLQVDRAVEVQLQTAGRGLERDGEDGGIVPEGRKADAAADGAGLIGVGLDLFLIADGLHALLHTLAVGVGIELVLGEAVDVAGLHEVLPAVGQRRHADGLCAFLRVALVGKRGLRHAVAAHRAGRGPVGEDGIGVALKVGAGIMLVERAQRLCHDRVAVRGVGALVGEAFDLLGGDGAVFAQPRDDMRADGVADTVGDEGLLARAVELDTAAAHLRAAPGAQRLIQRVLLVAEAAADVRLDDADVAPRAADGLTDDAADDVRDLRGAGHDQTAVLLVAEAAVVLDVAVLDRRRLVPALDLNKAGLLDGFRVVACGGGRVLEDVVGELLVQLGRAGLHGLLHVEHERQLLVFDLDGAHGLHGRDLVLRDDGTDVVAVVAHVPVEQVPVGDVLVRRIHRPRVTGGRERDVGHVEAGQDLHDAGDLLRLADVDRLDEAVRDGRVLDPDEQRILRGQIIIVFCPAGRLVEGVDADLTSAYDVHSGTSILPGDRQNPGFGPGSCQFSDVIAHIVAYSFSKRKWIHYLTS